MSSIISSKVQDKEEEVIERSLRPQSFDEIIGRVKEKENLKILIESAKSRGGVVDHIIFHGPPGLGKTSFSHVIAKETGVNIRVTSGPAIERAGDLASILTNLTKGDILFIDEIHRLNKIVEEVLYPAMEDFVLDIVVGKGPSAKTLRLELEPFTVIGATTRIGLIGGPLRDRFGVQMRLDFMSPSELKELIKQKAKFLKIEIDDDTSLNLAKRSRRTARIAIRLLKRVRDYAEVKNKGVINKKVADEALKLAEIDELGLDNLDRKILSLIINNFEGGPVGLSTISAAVSEEFDTIADVYEPYLIREGLLQRTQRGRVATKKAYDHLGLSYGNKDFYEQEKMGL